jgi:CheY-like chemotaxis protein
LVEDDANDVELTLRAFRRGGFTGEVVVVQDGQEALEFLHGAGAYAQRDVRQAPSLILLDLKLPRVSGVEVLRRVRAHAVTRLFPIVMLTSSREERDLRACYESGANGYVRKPVDFAALTEALSAVGDFWVAVNEAPPVHRTG